MQKNLSRFFFTEGYLTNTNLRIILLVLIVLFNMTLVSSKSFPMVSEFQQIEVTGTVTNEQGIPQIGVTVMVKGTTNGTITDLAGKYALSNVPQNATLVFSFIGMTTQEVLFVGQTRIDVVLEEANISLDEVVIVGYGSQKKASVVGAISQTTNAQLKQSGNVTDFAQALTGRLPGVATLTSSGEPGGIARGTSATEIYIRGQNTWNGGQALILVDGIERNLSNLDVSEVENVSVLKDASATAVFGVKGANGVILVTTKRGSTGKPKISFSYNTTAKMVSKVPGRLESYSAIMTRNESIEREVPKNEASWLDYTPYEIAKRYKLPQKAQYVEIYPNVDWEKAMLKDVSYSQHATLNVQGGTNFVNYFGSFSYLHEGDQFKKYESNRGYDPNSNFDRFNFRSNLDFKLTSTTKLVVNLSGFFSQKNLSNSWYNVAVGEDMWDWSSIYTMAPDLFLPRYSDGFWGWDNRVEVNPVASIWNQGILQRHMTEMNSDFALEQKLDFITQGLSARVSFFYDNSILSEGGIMDWNSNIRPAGGNVPEKIINPDLYIGPDQDPNEYTQYYPQGGLNQFDWVVQPWNLEQEIVGPLEWNSTIPVSRRMMYQGQINYARNFGLHNITGLGLVKREEYAMGSMFKNYREDWVFRTTYDYATRYLFEANGAYNGSEQFGPGYRFHFFPSLGVGWFISNEKFFHLDWINRLKIRYTMGMVGDDRVSGGRWMYSSQYTMGGASMINQDIQNSSPYSWYAESVVGNPDIHWEKALKKNIAIEIGLLKDLISFTYDYYTEDRTDILIAGPDRTTPPFFGATPPSANLGVVKSNGHELELRIDKRGDRGLHLWVGLALTHTQNEIIERDDPPLTPAYLKASGFPIDQTLSLIKTGFMNNWDEVYASVPFETNDLTKLPGYYDILDYKPDGLIKGSDDAVPYGYSNVPQNTFNTTFGADYKGFSIMVQFYGVTNVTRYNGDLTYDNYTDIYFTRYKDYWSKDNPNASSFLRQWKTTGIISGQDLQLDASYLRLKAAEIAYTFQDRFVRNAGLSGLKIYLTGNNLIFWSKLPDDRESTNSGGSAWRGTYPTVKRISLGVDLTF